MDSGKKALEYGAKALGYRMLTKRQLSDKMRDKGFSDADADYAIERLTEYGWVNDEEYGKALVKNLRNKGYGKAYISNKLREKGIEREICQEVTEDFQPDYERMKKYIGSKIKDENPDRAIIKKISDGLLRKGFSYEQIKNALKQYLNDEDNYEL